MAVREHPDRWPGADGVLVPLPGVAVSTITHRFSTVAPPEAFRLAGSAAFGKVI